MVLYFKHATLTVRTFLKHLKRFLKLFFFFLFSFLKTFASFNWRHLPQHGVGQSAGSLWFDGHLMSLCTRAPGAPFQLLLRTPRRHSPTQACGRLGPVLNLLRHLLQRARHFPLPQRQRRRRRAGATCLCSASTLRTPQCVPYTALP